jgi:hypothetical protein
LVHDHIVKITTAVKSSHNSQTAAPERFFRPSTPSVGEATPGLGKSWTRCAAIFGASNNCSTPPDIRPIIAARAAAAAAFGNPANRAASCQGSTPSRARAETTLSGIPFFSSQIGAKRKALSSVCGRDDESDDFIEEFAMTRCGITLDAL